MRCSKIKRIVLYCIIISLFLIGCSSRTYEDGYNDGFNDARFELETEYEWYWDEGYCEGYSDGFDRIADSRSDAEYYACDRAVFHPEEALMIIDAYENNEPFWGDEKPPSQQDYMDAARSLYYFYEYYFNGEFVNYRDP